MAVLEAVASGLPVVGGRDSGGVPFVLGEGLAGWLTDVTDAGTFAQAITALIAGGPPAQPPGAAQLHRRELQPPVSHREVRGPIQGGPRRCSEPHMSRKPSLFLITNEASPGDAAGQIDGYKLLESTGELGRVDDVSARQGPNSDPELAVERVLEAIRQQDDLAMVWTPGRFPGSRQHFEQVY